MSTCARAAFAFWRCADTAGDACGCRDDACDEWRKTAEAAAAATNRRVAADASWTRRCLKRGTSLLAASFRDAAPKRRVKLGRRGVEALLALLQIRPVEDRLAIARPVSGADLDVL